MLATAAAGTAVELTTTAGVNFDWFTGQPARSDAAPEGVTSVNSESVGYLEELLALQIVGQRCTLSWLAQG